MPQSDGILQAIHELERSLGDRMDRRVGDLDRRMEVLDQKLTAGLAEQQQLTAGLDQKLTAGLAEQQQLIRALQRDFGDIVERQLQDGISHQFGASYAKQLLARSIVDLCRLFPESVFGQRDNEAAGQLLSSSDLPPRQPCEAWPV